MKIVEILIPSAWAPLYHGTDVLSAAKIVYTDKLIGNDTHFSRLPAAAKYQRTRQGVSLTRSLRFAVSWTGGAGVVFELDGSALRQKYKIIQIDYYQDRREQEEFVIGSIKPLSKFLTHIYMNEETKNYCLEDDEKYLDADKNYSQLLTHPLLTIINFPPRERYFNVRTMSDKLYHSTMSK